MHYQNVRAAKFIDRPNRFIAHVELDGSVETVHVKNTGRCRELLVPGCTVYLEKGTNPNRKTAYDLIAVEKGSSLINMDAQAPNKVFAEWAVAGGFLPDVTAIRPEYTYGGSRLDFCVETEGRLHLVEVKGVTLEEKGNALFPDAPTERGVKHIRELQRAAETGLDAVLFFVVQIRDIHSVAPNDATHPAFGEALREAAAQGEAHNRVLRIGCFASIARARLPALLQKFRKLHPEIKIDVLVGGYELAAALEEERVQLALVEETCGKGFYWTPLTDAPLVAVVPPDFPWTEDVIPLERLLQETFLSCPEQYVARLLPPEAPRLEVTASDDAAILSMVAAGLGVSVLSAFSLAGYEGQVRVLPLAEPLSRRLGAAVKTPPPANSAVRHFLSFLKRQYPAEPADNE